MKVLNTSDLIEAAWKIGQAHPAHNTDIQKLVSRVVTAQQDLAQRLAYIEGVTHHSTGADLGFGGPYSDFKPGTDSKISKIISDADSGGEWDA